MTLNEYLMNPMGKGSSIIPSNSTVKQTYRQKYETMKPNIRVMWYIVSNKILVAHVKVPSSTVPTLSYDVVIEFDTDGNVSIDKNLLMERPYKIFSNSPSFMYTYANVYNSRGLLCKWLKSKFDKIVFKKAPTTRNQYNIISYEETTYIAALFIQENVRHMIPSNRLGTHNNPVKVGSFSRIAIHVRSYDEIKEQREAYEKTKPKATPKENNNVTKESKPKVVSKSNSNKSKTSPKTKSVPNTKMTKSSPSQKKTKKVKKI